MSLVENPASIGGTPQTMPTNNWWDGISAAVSDGVDIATRAAQGYVQIRQANAAVASKSVPAQNRPPGTFGLNPQASGVAGGQAQWTNGDGFLSSASPVMLGLAALALVALLVVVKK